ncbi:MAG: SAM-dependent methyltransferase, partial [Paracoccaceae bacterium]|nr:SAM-dependent methyltransferase [Paracoccaceae bacterium]
YGDWHSLGDTFQALRKHHSIHPFESPGQADLTAHVDFEALALAAPCSFSRVTPQGIFLERLGIVQRAQTLAKNLSGETLEDHVAAFRRLTHPDEMGTLFKVMALYPHGAKPPPGVGV